MRFQEREDATKQETKYELVLRTIAGLKLNDETPHIQKLQLYIALAKGVLDLMFGEQPECVFGDKLEIPREKRNLEQFVREECPGYKAGRLPPSRSLPSR